MMSVTRTAEEGVIWMFYPMGRATFIDKHPELYEGQSGIVVPAFEEEVMGRFMLADGSENNVKHGKPVPSPYLADVLKIHKAGYLAEYVWWFLNQPSWPDSQQPSNLLPFMVWAATELQGHVVETYGGIRIEPIQPESGASGEGTNVGGNDPSPPKDIRNAGGEPLRARVDAIAARIREGNVAEATRLLDAFDRAVRDLQSELAARYGCFRSNRELDFFLAESPAVKVLRILDWCVAEGMFLRAFLLSHSQRFEEALSCLEGVLKIAPTHARIYGEQGFVLNRLRQPQKAAAAYTHAWELAARLPENAAVAGPALRGLAVACVDLGDLDRAEKLLQESLVVEPGNPVANNEFIYVAQRRSGLANPANTTWHGTT